MNRAREFKTFTLGLLLALMWLPGEASAAQCGNPADGFETWKRQFDAEALARGVSASTVGALMTYASGEGRGNSLFDERVAVQAT